MHGRVNTWLIVSASMLVAMLYCGLAFRFGSFLIALLDTFNQDRSSTVTVQSLHAGLTVGFGVVSGALITRYGLHNVTLCSSILVPLGFLLSFFATNIEYLYVSIGIVTGIGNAMGFMSSVVVIGRVLSGPQMAFCLALHSSSISVGGVIYPYLINFLLSKFGLRGTFLILAGLQSNACVFSVLCWINKDNLTETSTSTIPDRGRVNKTEESVKLDQRKTFYQKVLETMQCSKGSNGISVNMKLTSYKRNGITITQATISEEQKTIRYNFTRSVNKIMTNMKLIMNQPTFSIILFVSGLSASSFTIYIALILDISVWKGFTLEQGLFSFAVYNISAAVARLLPGILKQRKGVSLFVFPVISTVAGCISMILLYFEASYVAYLASTCLIGIATGGISSSMTMIAVKVIHQKQVPVATGLQFTFVGIMTAVIGPVFGKLRDTTGSYSSVFMTIFVIHAVGVVSTSIALLLRRRQNKRTSAVAPDVFVIRSTKF